MISAFPLFLICAVNFIIVLELISDGIGVDVSNGYSTEKSVMIKSEEYGSTSG